MNLECVGDNQVVCNPEEKELTFYCCLESEVDENEFCTGWCSSKTNDDTSDPPDSAYLVKHSPGVSTNVGCLVDFDYLTAWKHNDTTL